MTEILLTWQQNPFSTTKKAILCIFAADLADVCSYLLMADIARRDVVVIATPAGLSLVTKETSVTFGYDKTVYVNDCKVPM